jgi:hypothetical protein
LLPLWNFWLVWPSSPKFLTSTLKTTTLWNMLGIDGIWVLCPFHCICRKFWLGLSTSPNYSQGPWK